MDKAPEPSAEPIVWALVLNQVFTPYGYVMDQTTLIVVQAYMVSSICSYTAVIWSHIVIVAMMLATLAAPLTIRFTAEPFDHIWWVSYQIALMVLFSVFNWFLPKIGGRVSV